MKSFLHLYSYIGPEDYPIISPVNIPCGTGVVDSVCKDVVLTADTRVEEEETLDSDALQAFVLPCNTTATVTIIVRETLL